MENAQLAAPCGIYCGVCEFLNKKCNGCSSLQGNPFWINQADMKVCPIYDCCINKKHLEHCGLCEKLPCNIFYELRDPALSDEEFKESILKRKNNLLQRKEIGTLMWVKKFV